MLVCNVSLRAPRAGITADIVELATAVDATATGNIVFAALVDAPTSVSDFVDAYSGEIMLEAATSADAVNAGLDYGAGIIEEATAIAAQDGVVPTVYTGAVTETVTAADSQDASMGAPVAALSQILSASRAGIGSVSVDSESSGKVQIVADIGAAQF